MAGRKPILEPELPKVYAALADFPLRDQALVFLGLNLNAHDGNFERLRHFTRIESEFYLQL